MSFTAELEDAETGARRRAHVAHFIVREGKLLAIANVKDTATADAAREARDELEAFLDLMLALQARPNAADLALMFGEDLIKVASVDVASVELITYGPRGGCAVGFDQELELSEEELTQVAEGLLADHEPAVSSPRR